MKKPNENQRSSFLQILWVFLRLGLTSFGGPVAHLGYFRDEFVVRRKWLSESTYADLVALCQFLPGPASSQVGFSIGLSRGGLKGGLAAWLGFTLPSAILMIAFGYGVTAFSDALHGGWLRGLKIAAVAVVAQAVWGMATQLCPDRTRATLALVAAVTVLAWPSAMTQVLVIIGGALLGLVLYSRRPYSPIMGHLSVPTSTRSGLVYLVCFFVLLLLLPVVARMAPSHILEVFNGFYRAGSLVFGGGHVVLPLLQAEVVLSGWLGLDAFLAGYGAAQAVPGPLFTFAAYLGAVMGPWPNRWVGGMLCLTAVFLPSILLVLGVLPFWEALRKKPAAQAALLGTNAAVVGILLAALYDPVWLTGIHGRADFVIGLGAFGLLLFWKAPSWLVVILSAVAGIYLR
jgi:chromate transporter